MSNIGGKLTGRKVPREEYGIYGVDPTLDLVVDAVKEQYYLVDSYEDQYMRWSTLQQEKRQKVSELQIISITCTPRWVSKTLIGIWF
jgi:hypothetical protein